MNKNSKIIVLIGRTASGKDFYLKHLLNSDLGLNRAVTYTDRPQRLRETHKVDYYFATSEHMYRMINNGEMLEHATYHTIHGDWTYGTHINSFQNDTKNYVVILDYEGFKRVQKMYPKRAIGFLLYVDKEIREKNYIKRGGEESEFAKQEEEDDIKLKGAEKDLSIYHVVNNMDNYEYTLELIKGLINYEMGTVNEQ